MSITVTRALIIDEPWIDLILDGAKSWEMRSNHINIRGRIGLIRKGSGQIWGVADLVASGRPLTQDEMVSSIDKHCIPEDKIGGGKFAKWNRPWVLEDVRALHRPVSYTHRSGAVTWAILEPKVSEMIDEQLSQGLES